ncbi:MAG TPA: alcohol dehydrogenase catalytic domain-containing protein [Acidimicrobiales bacterium]|nr:alcohol dehydrogenase catalytic domain-containing protein [Acidimicrobiales bacterium]
MGRDLMPAAVYVGDGRLAVEEVPIPEPGPGELLVEIAACGICGSDLHLVLEQYARPGAVLGHEWSGLVVNGGPSEIGPGERVVFEPTPGCGLCRPCRRGRPSVCVRRPVSDMRDMRGAFARYVTVSSSNVLRLPDSLDMRAAALTEPTAIALHAVELAGVATEDRVLVTGAGPVGLVIIAVLRSLGVTDISVSEPVALRRERALAVGATTAIAPDQLVDPGMGRTAERPYAVAFECSGRAAAAERALGQLDFAGTLVFVGTGSEPTRVNHNRMIVMELEAIGAYNYSAAGFGPAVQLLDRGDLPIELLVEDGDVPLSGIMDAMGRLSRGELAAKVLVSPQVS